MNKILIFALVLTLAASLRLHTPAIAGGVSPTTAKPKIDEFIRKQFPQLNDTKLVNSTQQVVAGTLYAYTYQKDTTQWTISVWEQSWLDRLEVTGVKKVEESTNAQGQRVRTTTTTRVETRNFNEIANQQIG